LKFDHWDALIEGKCTYPLMKLGQDLEIKLQPLWGWLFGAVRNEPPVGYGKERDAAIAGHGGCLRR
jgi:hypothetical protein